MHTCTQGGDNGADAAVIRFCEDVRRRISREIQRRRCIGHVAGGGSSAAMDVDAPDSVIQDGLVTATTIGSNAGGSNEGRGGAVKGAGRRGMVLSSRRVFGLVLVE